MAKENVKNPIRSLEYFKEKTVKQLKISGRTVAGYECASYVCITSDGLIHRFTRILIKNTDEVFKDIIDSGQYITLRTCEKYHYIQTFTETFKATVWKAIIEEVDDLLWEGKLDRKNFL